jgi:hypothetical protein
LQLAPEAIGAARYLLRSRCGYLLTRRYSYLLRLHMQLPPEAALAAFLRLHPS